MSPCEQVFTLLCQPDLQTSVAAGSSTSTVLGGLCSALRDIDEQVSEAKKTVAGKQNQFIHLTSDTRGVKRTLGPSLGPAAWVPSTNLAAHHDGRSVTVEFATAPTIAVPDQKPFRMCKHNLQARPICNPCDSIKAHPTIVFATLAVSRYIARCDGPTDYEVRPHLSTALEDWTVTALEK